MRPVTLGIHRLLGASGAILGASPLTAPFGLLTNDGAFALGGESQGRSPIPTRVALLEAGLPLGLLFSPEHGLSAAAPDGTPVAHSLDQATGLPVTSLYGSELGPAPESLRNLSMVLVDLQDVGARFYTYLWTLTYLMEACAEAAVPIRVLDRPNPVGGRPEWVEGPLPDPDAPSTLLCRWPIPIRHSLTLGEMALLLRAEMRLDVDLKVVAMEGWKREMFWPDTGLPFYPPSPGIRSFESALLYPGLAFLESTNLLEGRGTEYAFRWLGARWLVGEQLAFTLNQFDPGGIRAHPHPLALPGEATPCPGVLFEVTSPEEVRPVALGLRLLAVLRTLWPERFSWAPYPTAVNPSGRGHLLRLLAREEVAATLEEAPQRVDGRVLETWTQAPGWWTRAAPHLLYD